VRRRDFIVALGGAVVWPLAARAQQPAVRRIGYLSSPAGSASPPLIQAFRDGLADFGYVEGRNIAIEWRFSRRNEELPSLANELVQLKVEAVVATGGPAIRAVKQLTDSIPIVMAFSGDLVGTGLIGSLGRPGGNLTGLSMMSPDLSGKRLEILKEALPRISRVATLWNPDDPVYALELQRTEAAARTLDISLHPVEVQARDDFEPAFVAMTKSQADALVVFAHGLTVLNRDRLIELASRHRLPTMYGSKESVADGGLMAYGPSIPALYRKAAFYVDKILKGSKPGEIPVEQPTNFELAINRKTAKALGIEFPPTLTARADEVIEGGASSFLRLAVQRPGRSSRAHSSRRRESG
jgi:putative tryptophan/tyrosine transport system substrate-binding protein